MDSFKREKCRRCDDTGAVLVVKKVGPKARVRDASFKYYRCNCPIGKKRTDLPVRKQSEY